MHQEKSDYKKTFNPTKALVAAYKNREERNNTTQVTRYEIESGKCIVCECMKPRCAPFIYSIFYLSLLNLKTRLINSEKVCV